LTARKFIFGNWKMAQSLRGLHGFFDSWNLPPNDSVETAIFPSFIHLPAVIEKIRDSKKALSFGAQDCSTEETGAFTGEVSAATIAELQAKYVLIGHSERRQRVPETEETLTKKIQQSLKAGLIPVYCLGETERERDAGQLVEVIARQAALVASVSTPLLVAYEPVWAIGTGKVATDADIALAHAKLTDLLPKGTPILYGGSVNASNAKNILSLLHVDGLLVGGASLKPQDFQKIAAAASE
jgi:triosephosphate isomerase